MLQQRPEKVDEGRKLVRAAEQALRNGYLGYASIVARRG